MSDIEAMRKNAKRAYKARAFGEAAELYSQLLAAPSEGAPEAGDRLGYASALASLNRLDEAAVQMEHAIAIAPEDPRLRFKQGEILSRLGRHGAAADQFTEAARLAPDVADHHWRLALELRVLDREADAQAALRRCLEIEPSHTEAQLMQLEQIVVGAQERDGQFVELGDGAAPPVGAVWPSAKTAPTGGRTTVRQRLWVVAVEGVLLAAVAVWLRSLLA